MDYFDEALVGGGATETQRIAWIATTSSARKRQRRNPLRKSLKALRQLRWQQRRLLKKTKKESADFTVVEAKKKTPDSEANPNSAIEEAVLKKKSGRRSVIAVNHLFCPNPNCQGYQILGPAPNHNIVSSGTYKTKTNGVRHLYLCKLCGKKFSETQGTVFFGLKTPS